MKQSAASKSGDGGAGGASRSMAAISRSSFSFSAATASDMATFPRAAADTVNPAPPAFGCNGAFADYIRDKFSRRAIGTHSRSASCS
jgi:hypothetical protein